MIDKYLFLSISLVILPLSVYLIRKKHLTRNKLREQLLTDINENFEEATQNIVLSISKSNNLYKNLIKQVHPDKFHGDKKMIATELSKKVTNAKRNYKELIKLKEEVENFINSL